MRTRIDLVIVRFVWIVVGIAFLPVTGCGGGGEDAPVAQPTSEGAPGSQGPLVGRWSRTVFSDGSRNFSDNNVPGADVPASPAAASADCRMLNTDFAAEGSDTTVKCVGNIYTFANSDRTSYTTAFSLTEYQGCGQCGVGSTVKVQSSALYTFFNAEGRISSTLTRMYDETFFRRI